MRHIIIDRRPKTVALEDFVAGEDKPQNKKNPSLPLARFHKLLEETNAMKDELAWAEFEAKHFLALYCLLHNHVYGTLPDEVRDHFHAAVMKVRAVLKSEFNENPVHLVEYIRWVWVREAKQLEKRDPENTFRIGWRLQFGKAFLSDYRVAKVRNSKRRQ